MAAAGDGRTFEPTARSRWALRAARGRQRFSEFFGNDRGNFARCRASAVRPDYSFSLALT